jgi:hypothetical protein
LSLTKGGARDAASAAHFNRLPPSAYCLLL